MRSERLVVADLTKTYGVSVGPIREAIRRLTGKARWNSRPIAEHLRALTLLFKRHETIAHTWFGCDPCWGLGVEFYFLAQVPQMNTQRLHIRVCFVWPRGLQKLTVRQHFACVQHEMMQ
jgi:hypothetical protein